jgi:beta-glucosidase
MKGRTYRYFDDALFDFGYGLSYTTFVVGEVLEKKDSFKLPTFHFNLEIPVSNIGDCDGTEVIQLYVRDLADTDGPRRSLRGFQRVEVKAGQTVNAVIPISSKTFELWNPATNTVCAHAGRYEISYGTSSRPEDLYRFEITLE